MKPQPRLTHLVTGVSDGAVILEAQRYRFDHVWYAYEYVISALSHRFGPSQFLIGETREYAWESPAREKLKESWVKCAENLQLCTWCSTHLFPGFRCRAFLLGNDYCVYNPRTNTYRTARGRPLEELDVEPKLSFFGEGAEKVRSADFPAASTLPFEMADRLSRFFEEDEFAKFGFRFERGNISVKSSMLRQDCRIAFPFQSFGERERDYIRARCYWPDDTPIRPDAPGRN
jgi:hypothetical protein